jgi:hypothetical protein
MVKGLERATPGFKRKCFNLRNLRRRKNAEKAEAELRKSAYQNAYKKATETSRGLRDEKSSGAMQVDEDGDVVFGGEDEDLYKSLQKTMQAALKKQAESSASGPQAVARLAVAANQAKRNGQSQSSDAQDNKVVFTEIEEFVWSLQLDEVLNLVVASHRSTIKFNAAVNFISCQYLKDSGSKNRAGEISAFV